MPVELTSEQWEACLDEIRVLGNVRRALRHLDIHPRVFYRYRRAHAEEGSIEAYEQARLDGLEALADEIIDIGETPRLGVRLKRTRDKDGKRTYEAVKGDNVERSKLDSFNKMWVLAHLVPAKWGDKLTVDATVREAEAKKLEEALRDGQRRLTVVR